MNEAISSPQACKQLVRRALSNFRLPYITITPTFSICPKHGYLSGHHAFCPKCDAELLAQQAHAGCGCSAGSNAAPAPDSSTRSHHEGAPA
jgi:ribonucleoside-triphosphate reductase